jgi:hypothetical protein
MEPGHVCFLNYGEVPEVWHTRVILAPTTADNFAGLTPDHDIYEEQLSNMNVDLTDFHHGGGDGHLARRINPASVYGFAPLSPVDLARFMQQGRAEASNIRAIAGLGPLVVGQPAHVVGAVPPAPPPPVRPRVALEKKDAISRGDVLAVDPTPLLPGSQVSGERALVPVGNDFVFAKKVSADEVGSYKLEDLRVFPVMFDNQGLRRRKFNSSVALLDDSPPQGGGLQLQGPSTALTFLKMLRDQNQTPTTFHEYWIRTAEIPRGDRSVYEREDVCVVY